MKIKITLFTLLLFIALTGCKDAAPSPEPNPTGVSVALHNVLEMIEPQGVKLVPDTKAKENSQWVLNGVKPEEFTLERAPERLGIYIFKNKAEREQGFVDFKKQKEKYDMIVPIVWQNENAMVLYWHSSPLGQKTAYEDKLIKGLKGWDLQFPNKY
ncbi:hypothetical protein FHS18_006187 [Paenibacillus phyllosphaerae]|uniref:Lipoprotein n=1 Tax=Paenibacillus phyllosphaerae TaxID=274593 RepID=A0A7W5FR21_9BACL|nr:hypothetical protein [Paenibacillus phyllosphaerae]MBB3114071.1 hypothetical protein [Paenibacillus phyllosphaerae]